MKKAVAAVLAPVILISTLSGCTPMSAALGAGAATGVAVAQEGGIGQAVTDKAIYIKVSDLWMKSSFDMYRNLTLTVKEGRVLVAGSVPTPDMRVTAIRLAWQAEGVRQVINEVKVDNESAGALDGVGNYVTDTFISGNVKTKILFDQDVQSINYTVDTVNSTVYIMGIAQNQKELDRVLHAARTTQYVKNVVSYARLRGQTPPGIMTPTAGKPPLYPEDAPATSYAPPAQHTYSQGAPAGNYVPPGNPVPLNEPAPVQQERLGPPA
jgi:osmotically-inducible protein OsmY